jgi:protein-disulfide isomerase
VRFGYWNFAFLGQESFYAAEAAECASDQNAYWEYHDILFASQAGENQGGFSKDKLKGLAKGLNLNEADFNECLDSGKYTSSVQTQTGLAQQMGVTSTPAFVINGQPVLGAQPFSSFEEIIEAELAKVQ